MLRSLVGSEMCIRDRRWKMIYNGQVEASWSNCGCTTALPVRGGLRSQCTNRQRHVCFNKRAARHVVSAVRLPSPLVPHSKRQKNEVANMHRNTTGAPHLICLISFPPAGQRVTPPHLPPPALSAVHLFAASLGDIPPAPAKLNRLTEIHLSGNRLSGA